MHDLNPTPAPTGLPDLPSTADPEVISRFLRLVSLVAEWRRDGARVVQCHGCFDLFHVGHLRHFLAARDLGDRLVVTITDGRFVGKGPGRPVFSADERLLMIENLRVVDAAAINLWPSAVHAIELLRPAILAKGADYRDRTMCNPNIAAEETAVRAGGGCLCYTDEPAYSSTRLIEGLR